MHQDVSTFCFIKVSEVSEEGVAVGDQGVVSGDWAEAAFFGLDADVGHGGGGGAFKVAVTACGYADH